ncbi:MAG: putative zinc-binding protein [Candidatus Marinimicrobia bacterium]|nr:putative zinc-binding protein [Candidatus Neomarinimicrobiota bacterium]
MANCSCNCECDSATMLIFPCSGSSDTGEITDRAARKMSRDGTGSMACLAGIGGRVSGIVLSAEAAGAVLAIDGCPLDCARKTLELAGIRKVRHVRLSDLGFLKGRSEVNERNIAIVVKHGKEALEEVCS